MVKDNQSYYPLNKMVFRVPGIHRFKLPLIIPKTNAPFSSSLFLVYGFLGLIAIGTVLLSLPISSASGRFTSLLIALFTSTSAVSVTGLAVVDTGTYWSIFGQVVLLVLIQVGGLGFISGATILLLVIGGRLGLREKRFITESMGIEQLGGVIGIVIRVAILSLVIETIGAAIFYISWAYTSESGTPLLTAIFHAISSFNNSGLDIFGGFKSLAGYQGDVTVLLTTAFLIILGSTGYVIIADLFNKRGLKGLSLETKIVLTATFILLTVGTIFYFCAEYSNPATLGPFPWIQKLLVSFFQAVSPRTAGFSVVDIGSLTQVSILFTVILMFIGGSSGSAAGGLKIGTASVIGITFYNAIRGREKISIFGRQLGFHVVYRAISFFFAYLLIAGIIVLVLSATERLPLDSIVFETFSALSTVGLTTGITPDLSAAGLSVITIAMFVGRLGPLVFMAHIAKYRQVADIDYPHESIRLG
jgi:trk system potassium uptake protein